MTANPKHAFDSSIKTRLATKIVVLLSVIIGMAILTVGGWLYEKDKQRVLENLQIQLQLAANTISLSIDGDRYTELRGKESIGSDAFEEVMSTLERFMVNSYLGFERNNIYTFRRINKDTLQFTAMLEKQYVGNLYAVRDEMRLTLDQGKPSYTGVYEDENGAWVSAYAPILNSAGVVVGLVEVDFQNNVYLLSLEEEQKEIMVFVACGLLAALVLALLFGRYLSKPITAVSKGALQISQGNFDVHIPVQTADEIGRLARAFNYMVQEIQEKEYIRKKNDEISEANKQLDKLNKSLHEANRLKSEFLAIAAHDLKNPLQVIHGYLEIIQDNTEPGERTWQYCESISAATQRMLKLIKQLLDTTAIESGKLQLKKQNIDLAKLTESVVEDQRGLAQRKDQTIHFNALSDSVINADESRMHEILENLISNAVKFSPHDRDIFVSVFESPKAANKVCISVRDEGPGLNDADMQKLFGRFMRLSALPTGGEVSTGLGLSVVRQLTELHGGRVWAESAGKGKGATFYAEFLTHSKVTGSK